MRTNSVHEQDAARVAASMDARSGQNSGLYNKSREIARGDRGKYMSFWAVGK
jgi:hypothetical protein